MLVAQEVSLEELVDSLGSLAVEEPVVSLVELHSPSLLAVLEVVRVVSHQAIRAVYSRK